MARKRRLHKRYGRMKRNPGEPRRNPPVLQDMVEFIGPGFAAFAATRFLTRIAAVALARKKPSLGKHAGAITSAGLFAAAWFGAHRVKALEKYHTPIVVGSAIAALQSIIQLYLPKLGWMIADASPQLDEEKDLQLTQITDDSLPPGVELLDDDPNEFVYNDAFDNGRMSQPAPGPKVAAADDMSDLDLDDMSDLNLGSLGAN